MKTVIHTEHAPKAIGPYSQGISLNGFVFTSGQLPIDPLTGTMAEGIQAQTAQSLNNVKAILDAQGLTLDDVFKKQRSISVIWLIFQQ